MIRILLGLDPPELMNPALGRQTVAIMEEDFKLSLDEEKLIFEHYEDYNDSTVFINLSRMIEDFQIDDSDASNASDASVASYDSDAPDASGASDTPRRIR